MTEREEKREERIEMRIIVDAYTVKELVRDISYREIALETATEQFREQGAPEQSARERTALSECFAKGVGDVNTDAAKRLLYQHPRSLTVFANEHAHKYHP